MKIYQGDGRSQWRNTDVPLSELIEWARKPADHKDCGGYVLGEFREGGLRRNDTLVNRTGIALDFDHGAQLIPERVARIGVWAIWHTTYSSAPDDMRVRVIIPLSEPIPGEDYAAVASAVVERMSAQALVDRSCLRPAQFMWRPAAQHPDWYKWGHIDGPLLDSLALRREVAPPGAVKTRMKADPTTAPGAVGAFCRAYPTLDSLIAEWDLPYEKVDADRYRFHGTHSEPGMGPVRGQPGIYYSHHTTDPAGGEAVNGFDLVRIHKFVGQDDDSSIPVARRPSHKAMLELAGKDDRVRRELAAADFEKLDPSLAEVGTAWIEGLERNVKSGAVTNAQANIDLIVSKDPLFARIRFSELLEDATVTEPYPWDRLGRAYENISTSDATHLQAHLSRTYRLSLPIERVWSMIDQAARARPYNAVADRLNGLSWDGTPRLETCLPGVEPTTFSRLAARKALIGAVARALNPGCKVDTSLILYGPEGVGKTRWIETYGLEPRFVAGLGAVGSKDTLLTMNRAWILISDEVESLRRADFDALKSFLTKTHDNYRAPYARADIQRPRRCVVWGTTNDPKWLRRQEGNRRFLIVDCLSPIDPAILEPGYVEQVWAEAVYYYRSGEQVWLTPEEEAIARQAREAHTQEEPLVGQVQEYLDMDVPADWESLAPSARMAWYHVDRYLATEPTGHKMNTVCAWAIYREVMAQDKASITDRDMNRISDALRSARGWARAGMRKTVYGQQESYTRDDLADLL